MYFFYHSAVHSNDKTKKHHCTPKVWDQILSQKCPKYDVKINIFKNSKNAPPGIYPSYRKTQKRKKSDHARLIWCALKVWDHILGQKCPKYDLKIKFLKKLKKHPQAFTQTLGKHKKRKKPDHSCIPQSAPKFVGHTDRQTDIVRF